MKKQTLYRPVGPKELALIEASGWKEFPPRLPDQPIFYPVMNEEYALQIARDWNAKHDGGGYVTRFEIDADFVQRYPIQTVGGSIHQELWVPADELAEFNRNIVGVIEVIASFPSVSLPVFFAPLRLPLRLCVGNKFHAKAQSQS
jgi:hypothetical protein